MVTPWISVTMRPLYANPPEPEISGERRVPGGVTPAVEAVTDRKFNRHCELQGDFKTKG
jgi:hypothetical protein